MSTKKNSEKKKRPSTSKPQLSSTPDVQQITQQLLENKDKLLRAYAEIQNNQKRMEKEWSANEEQLKKHYLIELVDIYEIVQKAIQDNDPKPGLQLLLQNIQKFLEKEQVTYIDCTGKAFNPCLHHAITTVERTDCHDETIVEEIKKGYYLGDKLLRPSQVIVGKKKK